MTRLNKQYKSTFFALIAVLLCGVCHGQETVEQEEMTDKGIFLFSGNSNINYIFDDGSPLIINIGAGYFLMDRLVLGADFGYEKAGDFDDFYARPFARYYPFEHFYIGGGFYQILGEDTETKNYFDAEIGRYFALNDFFAFEPKIRYDSFGEGQFSFAIAFSIYY